MVPNRCPEHGEAGTSRNVLTATIHSVLIPRTDEQFWLEALGICKQLTPQLYWRQSEMGAKRELPTTFK